MGNKNKVNNLISLVILFLLSFSLIGCSVGELPSIRGNEEIKELNPARGNSSETEEKSNNGISVYNTDGIEITTSESVINMMEEEEEQSFVSGSELIKENSELFDKEIDNYVFSTLNDTEKNTYNEIYAILYEMKDDVELSTVDKDLVDHCFRCVLADHPEIFYVSGYSIGKYLRGNEIQKIVLKGCYTMDKQQVDAKKSLIEAYVTAATAGVSENSSEYDKVKYVYEFLINNNTYDMNSENNQNILSVVENGVTVCQGYAKMTQLLLNRMGVFCTLVNGKALSGIRQDSDGTIYDNSSSSAGEANKDNWGAHVWNIVRVDGAYYNVDTTWGDASFLYTDGEGDGYVEGPGLNYDYLMVPDKMIAKTHSPSPVVIMPECTSMEDNYYIHEGLYFTDIDKAQIKSAFDRAYSEGDMYVTLKCSDEIVYDEMRNYLFKNEKVFDFLSGTSVRYVEYTNRCVLTIYL